VSGSSRLLRGGASGGVSCGLWTWEAMLREKKRVPTPDALGCTVWAGATVVRLGLYRVAHIELVLFLICFFLMSTFVKGGSGY
jgi:hypothetical protein